MQSSPFDAVSAKCRDRKNERFASIALQLAVVLLLGSAAFLLAYSYNTRPAPVKVQWKPKGSEAKNFDLASLLRLLPAAAAPETLPDPPQAFFQSIEQDLAPWNVTGISYDHVSFCRLICYLRHPCALCSRVSFGCLSEIAPTSKGIVMQAIRKRLGHSCINPRTTKLAKLLFQSFASEHQECSLCELLLDILIQVSSAPTGSCSESKAI